MTQPFRDTAASDTGETYYLQPETKVTDWNPPASESVVDDPSYSQINHLEPETEIAEENPYGVIGGDSG